MSSCLLPNCTHQPSDTPLKLDPRKAAGRVLQNMYSICLIEVIREEAQEQKFYWS